MFQGELKIGTNEAWANEMDPITESKNSRTPWDDRPCFWFSNGKSCSCFDLRTTLKEIVKIRKLYKKKTKDVVREFGLTMEHYKALRLAA